MQIHRSIVRRHLDERLGGLAERVGPRPSRGWITTIRRAIGMSVMELALRLDISPSRASRLERAEVDGSVRLSTLHRVAAALNCRLVYACVPDEPLERVVLRQARWKAAREAEPDMSELEPEDRELAEALFDQQLDARALQLVDTFGLWRPSDTPMSGPA